MTFTHKVNSIYHSQKETLEEALLYIIHSLLLAFQTLIAKVLSANMHGLQTRVHLTKVIAVSVLDFLLLSHIYVVFFIHRFQIP